MPSTHKVHVQTWHGAHECTSMNTCEHMNTLCPVPVFIVRVARDTCECMSVTPVHKWTPHSYITSEHMAIDLHTCLHVWSCPHDACIHVSAARLHLGMGLYTHVACAHTGVIYPHEYLEAQTSNHMPTHVLMCPRTCTQVHNAHTLMSTFLLYVCTHACTGTHILVGSLWRNFLQPPRPLRLTCPCPKDHSGFLGMSLQWGLFREPGVLE